jgi:hypothetical protein
MDHNTATQMKAPERYVIGELADAERDAFEEHFAACSLCMDEVLTVSAFAANARAVFRERAVEQARIGAVRPRNRFWSFGWQVAIPAFAAAALAVFAIYQNSVTIPGLRAPQPFVPAVVLDGTTRSALPQVAADAPLRFQMAVPPGISGNRVWAELSNASGGVLSAGWVPLPHGEDPLDVYFPIKVNPGRYSVTIRTGQSGGAELSRNRFEVAAQEPSTR